jgi:uncharacterized protein (TIGR03435 family)
MFVVSRIAILMPRMFLLACISLRAQTTVPPGTLAQQPAEPPAGSLAFEVATFKPSATDGHGIGGGFMSLGYRATNFPLSYIVFTAYFPLNSQRNQVVGAPSWADKEQYDVVAGMDEATATSLMKLPPAQRQQARLLMLQKLLAERCKLVAHTVPTEVDGYALVAGKGGSHLTPTKPGEVYPTDARNGPDGSMIVSSSPSGNSTYNFFNATLEQLADFLSRGWPIQDQTSLAGRYDFTIRRMEPRDAAGKRIDDAQPYDMWDISATGLEIKRAKLPSENLVIDHIERPSPN